MTKIPLASIVAGADGGESRRTSAERLPRHEGRSIPRRGALLLAIGLLCGAAAARAQSDDQGGQASAYGDGTWAGDEGSWDPEAPPPADDGSQGEAQQPPPNPFDSQPQESSGWQQPPQQAQPAPSQPSGYGPPSYDDERPPAPEQAQDGYAQGYQDGQADVMGQTAGPSLADFHESLDAQGQWIDTPEYGLVWRPTAVDGEWRPYADGQWSYTEAGWYWNSAEPFAWATYHYGRWIYRDYRWYWLPGRVWAPAWVSWRWGGGYAGWAPLGPRGAVWASPNCWVVVEQRQFTEPARSHWQPIAVRQSFIGNTRVYPVTRPGPHAGPVVATVSTATGRPIRPTPIQTVGAPSQAGGPRAGTPIIRVFRPATRPIIAAPMVRPKMPSGVASPPGWAHPPGRPQAAPAEPVERFGGQRPGAQPFPSAPRPAPQAQPPRGVEQPSHRFEQPARGAEQPQRGFEQPPSRPNGFEPRPAAQPAEEVHPGHGKVLEFHNDRAQPEQVAPSEQPRPQQSEGEPRLNRPPQAEHGAPSAHPAQPLQPNKPKPVPPKKEEKK